MGLNANVAVRADLAPNGLLRASINLGNPVLAQGTSERPTGVTVDIAREIAARLGVPVDLVCFDAARKSLDAVLTGHAELCFLAIEPAREAEIAFTAPYVVIDGVFVVPIASEIRAVSDVDRSGVRIGVKTGSAYDLFLTRTLMHAEIVRGDEAVETFRSRGLEVAAGIRQPMAEYVDRNRDLRVVEDRFMQIQQAVGISRRADEETVRFLRDVVEELKATGFVAEALRRAGQSAVAVAPAA